MKNWKRALPALVTVLVAALAALAVVVLTRGAASAESAPTPAPSGTTGITQPATPSATAEASPSGSPSAAPPSAEPTPATTSAKPEPKPKPKPAPKPVKIEVSIAYHGWSWVDDIAQVGGVVEGVQKADGTCTLTMTREGRSVTGTAPATADEKGGVVCEAVSVAGAELSAGMWQAVLSYTGAGSTGSSSAVEIEVVK